MDWNVDFNEEGGQRKELLRIELDEGERNDICMFVSQPFNGVISYKYGVPLLSRCKLSGNMHGSHRTSRPTDTPAFLFESNNQGVLHALAFDSRVSTCFSSGTLTFPFRDPHSSYLT